MGNTIDKMLKNSPSLNSESTTNLNHNQERTQTDQIFQQKHRSLVGAKFSRHVIAERQTSTVMNDCKVRLLKKSWAEVMEKCSKETAEPGLRIYKGVFHNCPELRKTFGLSPTDRLDDLKQDHSFVRHARVFTNIMDLMVRNVEELDQQIAPALITYGRRHFYKHGVGFTPAYIAVFANAMIGFVVDTLGDNCTDEINAAWNLLVQYMVKKMKEGYQLEVMNARSKRFSSLT